MQKLETTCHIGKILHEDTHAYQMSMNIWANKLFPLIKTLKAQYQDLELNRPFTKGLLMEMITAGLDDTKMQYEKLVKNSVSKGASKFLVNALQKIALSAVDENITPLEETIKQIKAAYEKSTHSLTTSVRIDWDDIVFTNDEPEVNTERLIKHFQTVITTQAQSDLYSRLLVLQSSWNDVASLLKEIKNPNLNAIYSLGGGHGLVYESQGFALNLRLDAIAVIDKKYSF